MMGHRGLKTIGTNQINFVLKYIYNYCNLCIFFCSRGMGGVMGNHVAATAAMMVAEHGANNFATIRTTSIVTKQQKEHMQVCYYNTMPSFHIKYYIFEWKNNFT